MVWAVCWINPANRKISNNDLSPFTSIFISNLDAFTSEHLERSGQSEMETILCSGFMPCTTTRGERRRWSLRWGWPATTTTPWTGKSWKVSRYPHSQDQCWWIGGVRWGECELRECSTGESGGEEIRGWVAPVSTSFRSTGYPGDLKFPGRSDQHLPIFLLVAHMTSICYYQGREWRYPRPAATWWQGEEWGRWTTRQVEPGGGGGGRGVEIFFFKEARRDWIFPSFQSTFNLATRTFCSVRQALGVDSWVKGKVDKWAWLRGRQFGRFLL